VATRPESALTKFALFPKLTRSDLTLEFLAEAILWPGFSATSNAAAKIPIIAMTMSSSIRVKPFEDLKNFIF
jgi:hypothetical protein